MRAVFAGWDNFYLLIGSAAAALIGLMFVVTTLTSGEDRSVVERGQRLYTTPIVGHFSVVLVLSGAAMAPSLNLVAMAIIAGLVGAAGLVAAVRIAIGIHRASLAPAAHWYDVSWYGGIPILVYALLTLTAVPIALGRPWAASALAVVLMSLLLLSIHNAWDMVTWLSPRSTETS